MSATLTAKAVLNKSPDLRTPSPLDTALEGASFGGQVAPLEGVSPDPVKDPVGCFRKQVLDTWVPKWNEDNFNATDWFKHAESVGAITCKMYTPEQLWALENRDGLLWKEECHYSNVLRSIKLPLDPARSFSGRAEGPVVFVRCPERENAVIVVNGNHRAGAIMREEYNPHGHPLYALEFANVECFEKFAGMELSDKLYMGLEIRQGPRK